MWNFNGFIIQGFLKHGASILTQRPDADKARDFLELLLRNNSKTVIMLDQIENNKVLLLS